MDSNSDSDESGSRPLEWELLSSSDANLSDSNGNGHDGQVHEPGIEVIHTQHFECPPEIPKVGENLEANKQVGEGDIYISSTKDDWVEPSNSQQQQEQGCSFSFKEEQHDKESLDMFSSLVSSVLDDGKRDKVMNNTQEQGAPEDAEESLANLEREILSESGFTSLVPSDVHGNVLEPEDEPLLGSDDQLGDAGDIENMENSGTCSKLKSLVRSLHRAGTLWSLTIAAAALMGLVMIGRQLHHEKWQNQQLRLQLCYKDEKISQLLFQIARLKDAVSGRRRIPVVRM